MGIRGGIEKFINGFFEKAKALDGKIVGEDGDFIKTELAKTDRQAWVNHLVEQYLKHEPIDDPPPELKIITRDIMKEISKREIIKMFDNGK